MSEEFDTQQTAQPAQEGAYQDPLAAADEKPKKKSSGASTIVATIVSVIVFRFFGILGGLICFGGYWAVRAVILSKMPVAAKVILSVVIVFGFLLLMFLFILFAASLQEAL